jgi:uncharacterized protein (DUF697 family)
MTTATDTLDEAIPDLSTTTVAGPDKRAGADSIVKNSVIAAMAIGLVPIPLVGAVGLVGTNITMLQSLSKHYGVPFRRDLAKSTILSLIGGLLPISIGVGFSEMLKLVPGFGSVAGAAGTSILAGSVTYGVGRAFIPHFEDGQTFLTLDMARLRKAFRFEVRQGRAVAGDLAKTSAA